MGFDVGGLHFDRISARLFYFCVGPKLVVSKRRNGGCLLHFRFEINIGWKKLLAFGG
jgi:hypothetical protein